MKKVRILSIVLMSLLLGVLFINRNKLVSFAEENNVNMLKDTYIIKNNTSYLFNDYLELNGQNARCLRVYYYVEHTVADSQNYCTTPGTTDTHVVINNENADYWVVDSLYFDSTTAVLYLSPFDYIEPTFHLSCAPDKITTETYATCTVTAETYYNISSVQFNLSLDDFVIYDEVKLEDVEDLVKSAQHYVLTPKRIEVTVGVSAESDYTPFGNPVNLKLMEFKIKTERDQEVAVLGNIKLNNLIYTDVVGPTEYEDLSSTVGQDTVGEETPEDDDDNDESAMAQNKEEKENPQTQDIIIIAATLLVISFAVILTVHFSRKKVS